jgi:hypothetical protein
MFATNITPRSLTVVMGSLTRTIRESHPKWHDARELLKGMAKEARKVPSAAEVDLLTEWLDFPRHITKLTNGSVVITEAGGVFFKGEPVHAHLATRIMQHHAEGFDIDPLCRFTERLGLNPDKAVRDQLFRWLEETDMPITSDGHFLAYKYVNENMTSRHDGRTLHEIGKPVSMPREECDPNPDNHCSTGLHFAGWDYVHTSLSGNKLLLLKIDPVDVVCCPKDYNGKGRACLYTPIAIVSSDEYTGKIEVDTRLMDPVPPANLSEPSDGYDDPDDDPDEETEESMIPEMVDKIVDELISDINPAPQVEEPKATDFVFEYDGKQWSADELTKALDEAGSQRKLAAKTGIARSTLWGWLQKLKGA